MVGIKRPVTNTKNIPPRDILAESMIFGGSQTIERMEARGQQELCESSQLPADVRGGVTTLESLGIKVIGLTEGDPIFLDVVLPNGWSVKPTDHSMWTKLVDSKGRERAMIFYKAASYDRSAHMRFTTRFNVREDEVKDWEEYRRCPTRQLFVVDSDGSKVVSGPIVDYVAEGIKEWEATDRSCAACNEWLNQKYPDWENPAAYWDQEAATESAS